MTKTPFHGAERLFSVTPKRTTMEADEAIIQDTNTRNEGKWLVRPAGPT